MEVNFTDLIEKTIIDLFGKKSGGIKAAKIYRTYWNPINFAVVTLVGIALYYLIQPIFSGLVGNILSLLVAFFWTWTMTVGPFGSWWGFKTQTKKVYIEEPKPERQEKKNLEWHACKRKSTNAKFREVIGESEKVFTPAGEVEVSAKDFFIIKGVNGELYPIKKDIFKKTYKTVN